MASGSVVVLDAGTSAARCNVFSESGDIIGRAAIPWSYIADPEAPTMARAFDHERLWQSMCGLIRCAVQDARVRADGIAAVAATSQRQAVVFLDSDGHELYAGPNLDLRAVFEGAAIDGELRDRVYQTTGHLPSFFFTPAKLRWFKLHRPEAYSRIASVLPLADWIVWRLTGLQATEPTLAGEAGLLDIGSRRWASELLDSIEVQAPPLDVGRAGTVLAKVSADACRDTGLPAGTPVATAGADTQCGLLGLGVAKVHQVGVVAGWSAPLQMVTSAPVLSPPGRTWAGCFLNDDRWVLESSPGDLGNSYRWLAELLFGDADDRFDRMDRLAASAPLGSEGASAFLGPRRMDMTALGLQRGGIILPMPLTFSEVGREHLARAFLESCAYAVRANLEQAEEIAGAAAVKVAVGGGMTRSRSWVKILADVLGRKIEVPANPDVSALGACLCARTALGHFGSLGEAASSARTALKVVEPDPLAAAEYADHYERWVETSDHLGQLEI